MFYLSFLSFLTYYYEYPIKPNDLVKKMLIRWQLYTSPALMFLIFPTAWRTSIRGLFLFKPGPLYQRVMPVQSR